MDDLFDCRACELTLRRRYAHYWEVRAKTLARREPTLTCQNTRRRQSATATQSSGGRQTALPKKFSTLHKACNLIYFRHFVRYRPSVLFPTALA